MKINFDKNILESWLEDCDFEWSIKNNENNYYFYSYIICLFFRY